MVLDSKTNFRLESIPEPPETLSAGARGHWDELMPIIFDLGTARVADIPALIILCEARSDLDALQETLRRDGFCTESAAGSKKSHPAVKSLENSRHQVEHQMDRFGLLPGIYTQKARDYTAYMKRHHAMDDDE